jgi:predicted nucleic acid-binding protein
MNLYAESSAVIAWLLGEPSGKAVRSVLAAAEAVVSSDLTLVECDRVLIRAVALGKISEAQAADRRAALGAAAARWHILKLSGEVVERARRPFPQEPIRTLDSLHLSSALMARSVLPGLELLCLDERIRENALALGFKTHP